MIELNNICNKNIIIDGISGCGKTNLIFKISNYYKNLKILVLSDTHKNKSIENVNFFDYNAFCKKYYDDINIKKILKKKNIEQIAYEIIIIDDVQHITELYYSFIKKIYNDNINKAYLYIFGDKYGSININNINYLLLANEIFNFNEYDWEKKVIFNSKRINDKIALFINNCLLSDDVIKTTKVSNNKPKYYICDINTKSLIIINDFLNMGYKYDDMLILSSSLKTYSIKLLIKNLLKQNMKISISKEDSIDKILILSFDQIKDIERKIVIIFNFDSSYLKYYHNVNCLYIGATKSLEELVLLHHYKYDFLPYFKYSDLENYCNVYKICNISFETNKVKQINLNKLSSIMINNCMNFIEIENINKPDNSYFIINELNKDLKNHIMTKLNISNNAKYGINKKITIMDKYSFDETIDCIDNNNIYKFVYLDDIENINYISLAIQKYINEQNPTNLFFEKYENVYYKNEEYIIKKINKNNNTIKIINLNTAKNEIVIYDSVKKKTYENKYYLYNIYTNELNLLTINANDMIVYMIDNMNLY